MVEAMVQVRVFIMPLYRARMVGHYAFMSLVTGLSSRAGR